MTLYCVFGTVKYDGYAVTHFYGIYSTKDKARKIIKDLRSMEDFDQDGEVLEIRETELDVPTVEYEFMTMP